MEIIDELIGLESKDVMLAKNSTNDTSTTKIDLTPKSTMDVYVSKMFYK